MEWNPSTGWKKIEGTDTGYPNGVAVSPDGEWVYIASWATGEIIKVSRGKEEVEREDMPLNFLPDNLTWRANGGLFIGGQEVTLAEFLECDTTEGCNTPSKVAEYNTITGKISDILSYSDTSVFGGASSALDVGNEIWVGTYKGDRIARFDKGDLISTWIKRILGY